MIKRFVALLSLHQLGLVRRLTHPSVSVYLGSFIGALHRLHTNRGLLMPTAEWPPPTNTRLIEMERQMTTFFVAVARLSISLHFVVNYVQRPVVHT